MLSKKEGKEGKEGKEEKEGPECCSICSEHYTPILRKKITCKFCLNKTCCKCIEQYLLGKHEDAHCLHCRVNYTDAMLKEICTKTYLQQRYFKHRQEVLINRERASLPGLQTVAMEERKRRERRERSTVIAKEMVAIKLKRDHLYLEHHALSLEYRTLKKEKADVGDLLQRIAALDDQTREYTQQIYEKRELLYKIHMDGRHKEEEKDDEKRKFIRRCVRAGCQGFLSTAWKCGICEWYSCSKCFVERGLTHDAEHECKKEDVETAELIKKDCKPCPNCGEFIERHSGCSQMFCITCKTPWDWGTGKIVTSGPLHNPHYYEWMKRSGQAMARNPADVPCGGYPNAWELRRMPRRIKESVSHLFYEFHRLCQELQDVSTRNYRSHIDNTTVHDIHTRFLLGDFDEKHWGQLMAVNEKKRKRDQEIQDIFAAFRMVAVEFINRIHLYHTPQYPSFTDVPVLEAENMLLNLNIEIQELITMINTALKGVSQSYSYAVPYINRTLNRDAVLYNMATMNFVEKKKRGAVHDACDTNGANGANGANVASDVTYYENDVVVNEVVDVNEIVNDTPHVDEAKPNSTYPAVSDEEIDDPAVNHTDSVYDFASQSMDLQRAIIASLTH